MKMFCFQCEQTAGGTGCTVGGVCGKNANTANLQDQLIGEVIGLARAIEDGVAMPSERTCAIIVDSLFTTITNVNYNDESIRAQIERVQTEKEKLLDCASDCPYAAYEMMRLWNDNEDIRSLKSLLLFGMKGMAAYAHHAYAFGKTDKTVNAFFCKGLAAIGEEKLPMNCWRSSWNLVA